MAERESVNPHCKTKHFRPSSTETQHFSYGRKMGFRPGQNPFLQRPIIDENATKRFTRSGRSGRATLRFFATWLLIGSQAPHQAADSRTWNLLPVAFA
jgi:hypothetical protein